MYRIADESKMALIGTEIQKEFNGVMFKGTVRSYNAPYYEVVYDDGDFEEIPLTDLKKLLATERRRIREAESAQRQMEKGQIEKVHNILEISP